MVICCNGTSTRGFILNNYTLVLILAQRRSISNPGGAGHNSALQWAPLARFSKVVLSNHHCRFSVQVTSFNSLHFSMSFPLASVSSRKEKKQHMLISKQRRMSCSLQFTLIHKPDHYHYSLGIKLESVFDCKERKNNSPWFINLTAAQGGNFPKPLISRRPTPQPEVVRHNVNISSHLFNNANDKQKS